MVQRAKKVAQVMMAPLDPKDKRVKVGFRDLLAEKEERVNLVTKGRRESEVNVELLE